MTDPPSASAVILSPCQREMDTFLVYHQSVFGLFFLISWILNICEKVVHALFSCTCERHFFSSCALCIGILLLSYIMLSGLPCIVNTLSALTSTLHCNFLARAHVHKNPMPSLYECQSIAAVKTFLLNTLGFDHVFYLHLKL